MLSLCHSNNSICVMTAGTSVLERGDEEQSSLQIYSALEGGEEDSPSKFGGWL